ncbi:hypothetical protein ACEZ3G_06070 [Maribacter algicola]|uniref:Uncharacterized protein n=1 Tax=Meishania litoralis TaxID=3434685 RepID=A0ACC7LII8_9FLAO
MKLTEDQIQDLFNFVRKHHVEHYDLRIELVDHLANGIEAQWHEHPERSYKDARLREFRKFGVHGFERVVRKRRKAMEKKYWKIIFGFVKEWFKLPKIILTLTATYILFQIFVKLPQNHMGYYALIPFFILALFFLWRSLQLKKRIAYQNKKWMLEEMIFNQVHLFNLIIFPIHIFNSAVILNESLVMNRMFLILVTVILVLFSILVYVMVYIIPKKAEELLAETYPEYKMTA